MTRRDIARLVRRQVFHAMGTAGGTALLLFVGATPGVAALVVGTFIVWWEMRNINDGQPLWKTAADSCGWAGGVVVALLFFPDA